MTTATKQAQASILHARLCAGYGQAVERFNATRAALHEANDRLQAYREAKRKELSGTRSQQAVEEAQRVTDEMVAEVAALKHRLYDDERNTVYTRMRAANVIREAAQVAQRERLAPLIPAAIEALERLAEENSRISAEVKAAWSNETESQPQWSHDSPPVGPMLDWLRRHSND